MYLYFGRVESRWGSVIVVSMMEICCCLTHLRWNEFVVGVARSRFGRVVVTGNMGLIVLDLVLDEN